MRTSIYCAKVYTEVQDMLHYKMENPRELLKYMDLQKYQSLNPQSCCLGCSLSFVPWSLQWVRLEKDALLGGRDAPFALSMEVKLG